MTRWGYVAAPELDSSYVRNVSSASTAATRLYPRLISDEEGFSILYHNRFIAVGAVLVLLVLSGCAIGLPASVTRFQAMPAPAGQSFFVEPAEPARQGGLEFGLYAALVRQQLVARGYREAASPQDAAFVVTLDYGVDNGRIVPRRAAGLQGVAGSGYRPEHARLANFAYGYPVHQGWNDPSWFGDRLDGQTLYASFVELGIRRSGDGRSLFEGSARARSRTGDLQALVPSLVIALFTGFPGNNGETVRITVPPPPGR